MAITIASNIEEAIEIAKRNPEFEYTNTARVEVRPIKTKEVSTGLVYPQSINASAQETDVFILLAER